MLHLDAATEHSFWVHEGDAASTTHSQGGESLSASPPYHGPPRDAVESYAARSPGGPRAWSPVRDCFYFLQF